MKQIILLSTLTSLLLFSNTPIHDLMDNRIKGKSFSGTLDDNAAAQDGLGVLPLQHHTGTTDINNELLIQTVFNNILKTESDSTKTINIRTSLTNGTVGTVSDFSLINNAGLTLHPDGTSCDDGNQYTTSDIYSNGVCKGTLTIYEPNSLSSCNEILSKYPNSQDGNFDISFNNVTYNVYCDMTTDGGGWTQIDNKIANITKGSYNSSNKTISANNIALGSSYHEVNITPSIFLSIKLDFTQIKDIYTRNTTTQCATFVDNTNTVISNTNSGYLKNGIFTPFGVCTWSNPYGYDISNYRTWVIYTNTTKKDIGFGSRQCVSSDTGYVTHSIWIK